MSRSCARAQTSAPELAEFTGEAGARASAWAFPPTVAISGLVNSLKGVPSYIEQQNRPS